MKVIAKRLNSKDRNPQTAGASSAASRSRRTASPQSVIGNSATLRLFRTRQIQPKLTVSKPGDASEREADRIAGEVLRKKNMPAEADERTTTIVQRACSSCLGERASDEESLLQTKSEFNGAQPSPSGLQSYLASSRRMGQRLPGTTRAYFEPRFGRDLGNVRVHTDEKAARASRDIGAQAFTSGSDIYFGSGKYQPGTKPGDTLLAHEIVHSIQQGESSVAHLARQPILETGSPEIPTDLQSSPAVRVMTKEQLQNRYDRIVAILARFDISTPETAQLDQQLVTISNELARRVALEQKRTFDQRAIDQMKSYLIENAKTERDSCIVCMNKGIRKLLEDPNQKLTPESVDATMELLRQSGRASAAREIWFNDARGRLTRGGGRPHELRESIYSAVLEMVEGDVGWSVFGMSLMDGYHSVTLTADTNDPSNPKIYWSDQWQSKGGWKEYSRAGLDKEVTTLIQGWWDKQAEGKKHTTVVRLWRLHQ